MGLYTQLIKKHLQRLKRVNKMAWKLDRCNGMEGKMDTLCHRHTTGIIYKFHISK